MRFELSRVLIDSRIIANLTLVNLWTCDWGLNRIHGAKPGRSIFWLHRLISFYISLNNIVCVFIVSVTRIWEPESPESTWAFRVDLKVIQVIFHTRNTVESIGAALAERPSLILIQILIRLFRFMNRFLYVFDILLLFLEIILIILVFLLVLLVLLLVNLISFWLGYRILLGYRVLLFVDYLRLLDFPPHKILIFFYLLFLTNLTLFDQIQFWSLIHLQHFPIQNFSLRS